MADTDTIDKPPSQETGADTSTALVPQPSELESPKSLTATPPKPAYEPQAPKIAQELIPELKEAREGSRRTAEELRESVKREIELRRQQREQERPQREELVHDIDRELQFRREHPPQPPQALPPRPKLRYDLGELIGPPGSNKLGNQMMQAASAFAALSGGTMQDRMIIMLKAFNGMVDGWAQGKQERFKENYDEWRDQIATIRDTEQRRNKYINDVLSDSKESMQLKMTRLQMLGSETKDAILAESAYRQDVQAIEKASDATLQWGEKMYSIAEKVDKNLQTQEVEHFMDDPGVVEAARRYAHGLTNVPGQQYSARSPQRQAVATLAAQMMENEGITPEQREEMWRRTSAGRVGEAAAARTSGTMETRILSATGEVARLMPLARRSAEEVAGIADFNSVPLQTLRNAWLQGTSDPRFDRFLVNNESLLRAWVRAMNPTGQPRVGQEMTARAEGVLSKAVGLRGYEAMLDALWQEVQASREAVEDVRAGRAPPNPFEGTAPITAPARRWPTPPPAAIEDLRKAPATRDKFDEIFGPGAAGRALGGA